MKIGIIGAGNIGRTVGTLLGLAGHEAFYGVRKPDGHDDEVGTAAEAVAFGEVVVFAAPFGAWPDFAAHHLSGLASKVVIDASNPVVDRDGDIARIVVGSRTGSAEYVARLLPDSLVAKTFNTVYWVDLKEQSGRSGVLLGMPIVSASVVAAEVAGTLARDAGFEPVNVGGLERGLDLDPGSAIYAKSFTAPEIRTHLGLES